MTLYIIIGYIFIAVATAIATIDTGTKQDLIASLIAGFLWPLFILTRIIHKIVN